MTYTKKGQSAAQIKFSEYVQEITDYVLKNHGPSYATQSKVRNTWRNTIEYKPEIEQDLILQTRTFIRVLSSFSSNSTNPQFLQALTKLMADYLSAYTMKKPNCPNRKKAKELLQSILYDENPYIKNLLARQAAARAAKNHKPATTKRPAGPHGKKYDAAKREFDGIKKIQINITHNIYIKGN